MLTRRTPMRRTSIERDRAPLPRMLAAPRRSERVRDPCILEAVHALGCCARRLIEARCWGAIQADHAGRRPLGRKCHDTEVIPLCLQCHADRTNASTVSGGPFASMSATERRAWCDAQIVDVQTWFYGRPLVAADLELVRATVAEGRSTARLFLPFPTVGAT